MRFINSGLIVVGEKIKANMTAINEWAQSAGQSGGQIEAVFGGIGSAIGRVADAIQIAGGLWHGLEGIVTGSVSIVAQAILVQFKPLAKLLDLIPGIGGAIGQMTDALVGELNNTAMKKFADASKAFSELPSGKINTFFSEISAKATATAKAMAASGSAAQKMGQDTQSGAGAAAVAAANLADKIAGLEKDLDTQIITFGKSSGAVALYKLRLEGASAEQLESASGLTKLLESMEAAKKATDEQADAAKRLFEETRTPFEQYQAEIAKLDGLFKSGAINQDLYKRGIDKASSGIEGEGNSRFASAMEYGSAEARSTILNYRGVDQPSEPQRELVKKAAQQVDQQAKTNELLQRLLQQLAKPSSAPVGQSSSNWFTYDIA